MHTHIRVTQIVNVIVTVFQMMMMMVRLAVLVLGCVIAVVSGDTEQEWKDCETSCWDTLHLCLGPCRITECNGIPCTSTTTITECNGVPYTSTTRITECNGIPCNSTTRIKECNGVPCVDDNRLCLIDCWMNNYYD